MNRKQLRQAICGSAVLITLGGGLLSQASGDGGFISRLWDKRPRLSESRLNPTNWFSRDDKDNADADLKTVVTVRPELTRNPFAADAALASSADSPQPAAAALPDAISRSNDSSATEAAKPESRQQSNGASQRVVQKSSSQEEDSALPKIVPGRQPDQLTTSEERVPAPSIDAIFHRPSEEMIERARRRKAGQTIAKDKSDETKDEATSETLVAKTTGTLSDSGRRDQETSGQQTLTSRTALLQKPASSHRQKESTEPGPGHVSLGTLVSDESAAATGNGYVRLTETSTRDAVKQVGPTSSSVARAVTSPVAPTESDAAGGSAYERLLSQVTGSANGGTPVAATLVNGVTPQQSTSLTVAAPRLPESLNVNPSAGAESQVTSELLARRTSVAAADAAEQVAIGTDVSSAAADNAPPSDAQTRSIDEMIAQSRAEMNSTFLTREMLRERGVTNGARPHDSQTGNSSVSQAGAVSTATTPPLMVPSGFEAGRFRTYGESDSLSDSQTLHVPRGREPALAGTPNETTQSQPGLSRIEQAVRSAQQAAGAAPSSTAGPIINPGPVGSGVVIDGSQYSVVRPRVTSNAAPSISVPDNSEFRRLSYERRADELAGQVERLATADSPGPLLIIPGEPLPQAKDAVPPPEAPEIAYTTAPPVMDAPIDWPDETDLAPAEPKTGGTSWGLIIFCLALLTAGGHIAVCRFRQSRTAGSTCKS
ncbi:hypothetical protein GC176_21490 [bacterium]|nr:hypothetical protein [bacterium]